MVFTRPLLRLPEYRDAANQARRAATSVAANYRAVCLARSRREFMAKLGIVLEEADEVLFWLPLLCDAPSAIPGELEWLLDEAKQLTRIFAASSQTAKANSATRRPRD